MTKNEIIDYALLDGAGIANTTPAKHSIFYSHWLQLQEHYEDIESQKLELDRRVDRYYQEFNREMGEWEFNRESIIRRTEQKILNTEMFHNREVINVRRARERGQLVRSTREPVFTHLATTLARCDLESDKRELSVVAERLRFGIKHWREQSLKTIESLYDGALASLESQYILEKRSIAP